jgi:hypothetical protein
MKQLYAATVTRVHGWLVVVLRELRAHTRLLCVSGVACCTEVDAKCPPCFSAPTSSCHCLMLLSTRRNTSF